MKRSALLPLLALLLVLGGCGHSLEYTPMNASPRPLVARDAASVEMFMATRPERPHVEIGLFEIEQRSPTSGGTPEMLAKVRARAGAMGCDAVVVSEPNVRVQGYSGQTLGTVQNGMYQGTPFGSASVVRGHRAACIVYTDAGAGSSL